MRCYRDDSSFRREPIEREISFSIKALEMTQVDIINNQPNFVDHFQFAIILAYTLDMRARAHIPISSYLYFCDNYQIKSLHIRNYNLILYMII